MFNTDLYTVLRVSTSVLFIVIGFIYHNLGDKKCWETRSGLAFSLEKYTNQPWIND